MSEQTENMNPGELLPRLPGVIFDMDGTLIDTERIWQDEWMKVGAVLGRGADPRVGRDMCGVSGPAMREIVLRYHPEADAELYVQTVIRHVREREYHDPVPILEGAVEILQFLRANEVRLAIASSSPIELIRHNLEQTGMIGYFDELVCGADAERSKPEPDIFLIAASRLQLEPGQCYVFEDGINGAVAGVRAGCPTIMIPDLQEPTEWLRKECTAIFPSLTAAREALTESWRGIQ